MEEGETRAREEIKMGKEREIQLQHEMQVRERGGEGREGGREGGRGCTLQGMFPYRWPVDR